MVKCCDISAGKLRQKVKLQNKQTVSDGGGGTSTDWVDYKTVWADVRPISGGERIQAMRLEGTVTHRIWTRYKPGINETLRVLYKDKPMQIKAALNVEERNQWLELYVEEGVAT